MQPYLMPLKASLDVLWLCTMILVGVSVIYTVAAEESSHDRKVFHACQISYGILPYVNGSLLLSAQ